MGERIRRTELNQLMRSWKGGEFESLGPGAGGMNFQRLAKVFVTNGTAEDLIIGQKVAVGGFRGSYEDMLQSYLSNGYMLDGISLAAAPENPVIGFCLEPIKKNHIGEVFINGLCVALMDSNSSGRYAKIDDNNNLVGTSDEDEAEFVKVQVSDNAVDGKYLAYLVALPKPKEVGGHLVGVTQGVLSGTGIVTVKVTNGTTDTYYDGVTCPLLRDASGNYAAETIDKGVTVIMSKNRLSGAWQIIEAQCPRS